LITSALRALAQGLLERREKWEAIMAKKKAPKRKKKIKQRYLEPTHVQTAEHMKRELKKELEQRKK